MTFLDALEQFLVPKRRELQDFGWIWEEFWEGFETSEGILGAFEGLWAAFCLSLCIQSLLIVFCCVRLIFVFACLGGERSEPHERSDH